MHLETDGIARILGEGGIHVGMAIVVDRLHVLTCAHVINFACKRPPFDTSPPDQLLTIEILFPQSQQIQGRVEKWGLSATDKSTDLAVLKLTETLEVPCARFTLASPTSMTWKAYGQTQLEQSRCWTTEVGTSVSSPVGGEFIQLDGAGVAARQIEEGYSGAAVWCSTLNATIGIVASRHRDSAENRVFKMIPAEAIHRFWAVTVSTTDDEDSSSGLWQTDLIGRDELRKELDNRLRTRVTNILLHGDPGVGKKAILWAIFRRQADPTCPWKDRFSSVISWTIAQRISANGQLTKLFGFLLSNLGIGQSQNSSLKGQSEALQEHLARSRVLILIDSIDLLLNPLPPEQQQYFLQVLNAWYENSVLIMTAASVPRYFEWDRPYRILPLSPIDAATAFRRIYQKEGVLRGLNAGDIPAVSEVDVASIVGLARGLPGRMADAAKALHDGRSVAEAVKLLWSSSPFLLVRTESESQINIDPLITTLMLASSRSWAVVHDVCKPMVGDFEAAKLNLIRQFPEIQGDGGRAAELSPDLLDKALRYMQQPETDLRTYLTCLRDWVSNTVNANGDWQRHEDKYRKISEHADDLRSIVETILDKQPPEAAVPSEWVSVAEIVHHFGAWNLAAGLMNTLLAQPNVSLSDRLFLKLLLARHHSYRGNQAKAASLLDEVEAVARDGKTVELTVPLVQARLRRGQANRFKPPGDRAEKDLLYVMDHGTIYDYLVAAGFIADVYVARGDLSRAENVLRAGLAIQSTLEFPWKRIQGHHFRLLGAIKLLNGNWKEASTCFSNGLELAEKWAADQRLLGWCWLGIATCKRSRVDAEAAANTFKQLGAGYDKDLNRSHRLLEYFNFLDKGKRLPLVFVLGGPASGKTTLRDTLAARLIEFGLPTSRNGIDEAQRICNPPPGRMEFGYEYLQSGAIILHDRKRLIPEAYNKLRDLVRNELNERRLVIVEFTYPDLKWAFMKLGPDLLQDSIVFYLNAPPEVRRMRNSLREATPGYVPDRVVDEFDGRMDAKTTKYLKGRGASLIEIDAMESPARMAEQAFEVLHTQIIRRVTDGERD